jgi:hypothetical protein
MNNNIEPIYVNYDFAKFLKEKGFEEHSDYNQWILAKDVNNKDESKKFICHSNDLEEYTYINEEKEHNVYHCLTIPEHWQVIEWLNLNHGIWVSVNLEEATNEDSTLKFHFTCHKISTNRKYWISGVFDTPQEAYSAAFDYIKTKQLI